MVDLPDTQYATTSDGVRIAYQVVGEGPPDVVYVGAFVSHVELGWESPIAGPFLRRLASFSRLVVLDKRGVGLSERLTGMPTLEQRMDDVRAVMDAVGLERAVLMGISEGGQMNMLFAATYPERVTALVLYATYARMTQAPDYPYGLAPELIEESQVREWISQTWGTGLSIQMSFPSLASDEEALRAEARLERYSASPEGVVALSLLNGRVDVRDVLPAIQVPTIVLHHANDPMFEVGHGRYLAEHIAGARYVELPGSDHGYVNEGDPHPLDDVEEFLTGVRRRADPDRVLATVLFTDIVESTRRAAEVGDRRWRELLDQHDDMVRIHLMAFRGQEVKATGDGFLATFDGPGRAIECACAIRTASEKLGIGVRAGVHTGEVERRGQDIGGISVHIGQRVSALAGLGEVMVSRTVVDLVAGSGIEFEDRGEHDLKGVPGAWRLFAVTG